MIGDEVIGEPVVRKLDEYDVLVRRQRGGRILDKVAGFRDRGHSEPSLGDTSISEETFRTDEPTW